MPNNHLPHIPTGREFAQEVLTSLNQVAGDIAKAREHIPHADEALRNLTKLSENLTALLRGDTSISILAVCNPEGPLEALNLKRTEKQLLLLVQASESGDYPGVTFKDAKALLNIATRTLGMSIKSLREAGLVYVEYRWGPARVRLGHKALELIVQPNMENAPRTPSEPGLSEGSNDVEASEDGAIDPQERDKLMRSWRDFISGKE